MQGWELEQPPEQMSPAHVLGAQVTVWLAGHAPLPSHEAATVATPLVQLSERHEVVLPGKVQDARSIPSQVPPQGAAPVQALRPVRGAPVTATHRPLFPDSAHASQFPEHALSQQTASTQNPDRQSDA